MSTPRRSAPRSIGTPITSTRLGVTALMRGCGEWNVVMIDRYGGRPSQACALRAFRRGGTGGLTAATGSGATGTGTSVFGSA